jgi:hypothetical protein
MASCKVKGGRTVGIRFAIIDFPTQPTYTMMMNLSHDF